jgi:predicted RNA binding protein YcfA (HicA-like mRNA interferase family)
VSGRLPRVTGAQLGKILQRAGWELDRVTGSHFIYVKPQSPLTLSVPRHHREMSIGTLSRLLKDAGISREEFRRLL